MMLDCDRCHRWFHGHCVGITSQEVRRKSLVPSVVALVAGPFFFSPVPQLLWSPCGINSCYRPESRPFCRGPSQVRGNTRASVVVLSIFFFFSVACDVLIAPDSITRLQARTCGRDRTLFVISMRFIRPFIVIIVFFLFLVAATRAIAPRVVCSVLVGGLSLLHGIVVGVDSLLLYACLISMW